MGFFSIVGTLILAVVIAVFSILVGTFLYVLAIEEWEWLKLKFKK